MERRTPSTRDDDRGARNGRAFGTLCRSADALDHRGHGLFVGEGGTFGDYGVGGFAGVVEDLAELVRIARREQPDAPLILLGHSMGSMIAQAYALDHSREIDGLALSGSAAVDRIAAVAINPEIFGNLNASFEPARTPFDWLSRDDAEVDLYLADRWCGFALTPGSFTDLLSRGNRLADPAALGQIRDDLPIYIFSGSCDPLHADLDAVTPLIERYRAAGLNVDARIYEDARHEVFNETNRDEVVGDLAGWLDQVIARRRA